MTIKLTTERLDSGRYITRPTSALGTCGFHPFPWDAAIATTEAESRALFIANHAKYLKD